MKERPKNVAAFVRGRLQRVALERREDVQLVLTRYANQRLLHRLSVLPHASRKSIINRRLAPAALGRTDTPARLRSRIRIQPSSVGNVGLRVCLKY